MADTTSVGPAQSGGNIIVRALRGYHNLPTLWQDVATIIARFYLAIPFWNAGNVRLSSWDSQAFLFEWEHPLPLLSPSAAAWVTTAAELVLPVLLIVGLFGRLAALGLGIMAATIYFVIGGAYAIGPEQFPWMAAGLILFLTGPGRISLDHLIARMVGAQR